jgi:carbon-monoxide dehydrogenase small subunit
MNETLDPYELTVNGEGRTVVGAVATDSLLRVLRDHLDLAGSKNACEQGECGSCSVLVDGALVCSCLELAAAAGGCDIRTIESIGPEGLLSDVQQAMVDAGAVQCGFCTPGFVVAIHDLLDHHPDPDDLTVREALAGNLCRCTGYGRILDAVTRVVLRRGAAR